MRWRFVIAFTLAITFAATAVAVEVYPGPPDMGVTWARGEGNTTWQHWGFSEPMLPAYPELGENEFGEPSLEFETGAWEWSDGWPCPPGMDPSGTVSGWHCTSPTGGKIVITIPNNDTQNDQKLIFMQLTSSKSPTGTTVTGDGAASEYTSGTWPPGTTPPQQGWGPPAPPFPGSSWYTYFYGLVVQPNPDEETITIEVAECTVIEQIVIDTLCTTDPFPNEDFSWGWVKQLFGH